MRYEIISTGSKGNALLLGKGILIDCGVSYRKLKDKPIRLIVLTHEHKDHFNPKTIQKIHKEHPLVRFVAPPRLTSELLQIGVDVSAIDMIKSGEIADYNGVKFMPFDLIHDVPNVGWWGKMLNGETFCYITDTGYLDHLQNGEVERLKNLDYYFIEANYNEQEMIERIESKLANGEYCYETRAQETHLSREQAERFLNGKTKDDSKVVFIHGHEDK